MAQPKILSIARDNATSLRGALAEADDADLLVTLGGASVGDHDIVADVLREIGLTLDFHKVAMRPGKPMMAGKLGKMALIGLPGNPVSAMVCGRVFLVPAVRVMLGVADSTSEPGRARLSSDLGPNGPRQHFMRGIVATKDGNLIFTPAESQDSSRLGILANSNALAPRPPNDPPRRAGEEILILSLHAQD